MGIFDYGCWNFCSHLMVVQIFQIDFLSFYIFVGTKWTLNFLRIILRNFLHWIFLRNILRKIFRKILQSLKFPPILPQIFAPIFLEKIAMQKILQNFAQKNTENLLNEKKPAKLCGNFFEKINGKSLKLLARECVIWAIFNKCYLILCNFLLDLYSTMGTFENVNCSCA